MNKYRKPSKKEQEGAYNPEPEGEIQRPAKPTPHPSRKRHGEVTVAINTAGMEECMQVVKIILKTAIATGRTIEDVQMDIEKAMDERSEMFKDMIREVAKGAFGGTGFKSYTGGEDDYE